MRKVDEAVNTRLEEASIYMGCKSGGRRFWNVRYADDTTLLARTREHIEKLAELLSVHSKEVGLKINTSKTKVMTVFGDGQVNIDSQPVERTDEFIFLGSKVMTNGVCSDEIRRRIAIGKATAARLTPVWRSSEIGLATKRALARSLIWSTVLYGAECWTMRKADELRITAFEMWLWRKLLRVKWTDRRTNAWVRSKVEVKEEDGLVPTIKKRRRAKYDHWRRRPTSLLAGMIDGLHPGKNRRGRPRLQWREDVRRSQRP